MADQTELRMNLAAVKRADPYAKEIVETSAHVAFYTYNYEDIEWEKTDVEGAFFVYRRTAEPFHSIFINNRLNTDSLVEPITADLEFQAQPPFLLYRNERSRIRGFWFYNKDELQRVAGLLNKLIKECQKRQSVGTGNGPPPSQPQMMMPGNNNNHFNKAATAATNGGHDGGGGGPDHHPPKNPVNIFSMLSKAQEDFYNSINPAAPNQGGMMPQPPIPPMEGGSMLATLLPKMNVNNGPPPPQQQQGQKQQQQPPQILSKEQVTSQSVMNFFAAAKPPQTTTQQHGGVVVPPQVVMHQQQQHQQPHSNGGGGGLKVASPGPPLLQRLMSNPVHTVEQIEMQQRAVTPQEVRPATSDEHGVHVTSENGFNWKAAKGESKAAATAAPNVTNGKVAAMDNSWAALFQGSSKTGGQGGEGKVAAREGEGKAKGGKAQPGTPSSQQQQQQSGKPALMTPTMFKKSADPLSKEDPTNPSLIPTGGGGGAKREGPAPGKKAKGSGTAAVDLTIKPEPLTQSQMLQAMTYLMKTDAGFMKKLHEAYLKSFADMMA